MAPETGDQSVGQEEVFKPAGGLNIVCQENQNSENGANVILYIMRAETNVHAFPTKTAQCVREDLLCFRTNGDKQSVKSVDKKRNLSCHVPSTLESTVLSPGCQGDVNNVIYDGAQVQYWCKPNCEYKKPELYSTHRICDQLISSYQKVTTHLQRCTQLEHHNFHNYISSQEIRDFPKNITRHIWHKLNGKQLLLTLILQTCINFAAGRDVPVIQAATYQPCLPTRSSSHLIYERHPNNCSVFYMCHGTRSWPMSCTQENTVFSVKHKVCVWRNSNFDDCQDKFANVKKDSLQESNLPSLTHTRENNGQIKYGGSLTDTFLHENYNHKNENGLNTLNFQNREKRVMENVDQIYNPSRIISHVESIPKYSSQSLFPVNEKRVSWPGDDSLPLGTKDTTDKSRTYDTKLTTEGTALKQNDDLSFVDSKETVPKQDTAHENHYVRKENYIDDVSEDGDMEEGNNDNRQNTINQGWNKDQTGRVTIGFDNKKHVRTITLTSIKEKIMGKRKHDTFDQTYKTDSTTRQPLQSEHSEIITDTSSYEHSTPSSYYDYYDERTSEPLINDGYKEHTTSTISERKVERKLKYSSFDRSTTRTRGFRGFYKNANGIRDFSINDDNVEITTLPQVTDEITAVTPSTIGSYLDSIYLSSLKDDYVDYTEVPSSTNENLDQSTVNREKVSHPFNDEDSGNTRESVHKRNVLKGDKNGETSKIIPIMKWYYKSEESDDRRNVRIDETTNNIYEDWSQEVREEINKTPDNEAKHGSSFEYVQTLLKKNHHLQDGKDISLRTFSYGQNVIEPLHLGKSWLERQNERQTALTTDRKTDIERNISTGKQVVHLNDDEKNPSNNLRFQDKTTEEHFSTADENYGTKKALKFDGTVEDNQFPKVSQNVRESNFHYSSLLQDKKQKSAHTKDPMTGYNDKQTKQNEDDKANAVWYAIKSGLGMQSTEDQKHKFLTPDLTQSTKTEFVDNSVRLKSDFIVQPWPQLTQNLHNKQTRVHDAIDNLLLMETFLRMLNITVHRHDVQVKDVQVKDIGTTNVPRLYLTPTVLPNQSWTTERPAHVLTHRPPWKSSQDDFKIPKNQKDGTVKVFIPKVKYNDEESLKNNGRFFEDGKITGEVLKEEKQYRDKLAQNEDIPRNLLVQLRPQQNQNQEHWNKQKQQQDNQYQQNQDQHKRESQLQQNQQNRSPQNQHPRNQYEQNQNKQNKYQQDQYQQNQNQHVQYQHNQNHQNQNQQNQQNQNQHLQYQHNQNQQKKNQQIQNHQNQNQQNQNQMQFEQSRVEHLQNRTLNPILRNDFNQRKPNTRQHSTPRFWEVKVDRPWFEKLLNKDKIDIGQKNLFDQRKDENNKDVPQLDNVKHQGFQSPNHRSNYYLGRFRKQRNLNFGPNGKHDLLDSKMEQNIKRGINLKREDKNSLDDDLKRNILLLQNENLHKHKQLLLDIRNKTSKKLLKIKMDQISNFYTENDIEYESSDYEDSDFSFMAQPLPVDPLPQPTKESTTTTTATTSQTATNRSDDRKLPHSFDPDHIPTYRKQLKDRCGIMATPLIIGGQRSRRGQWPWQASLQIVTSTTPWHRCGAVLVHPKWVLTAAHCMEGSFYGETSNWRVVLADYNLETVSGNEIYRDVVRVISHPGYIRTSNFPNDVAVLELDSPLDMTSGDVQTACMPDSDFPLVPGMKCWISGWGETRGTGGQENTMNEVTVDVLPHEQCKSMWGKVNINVLDSQVCLGHGQTGACYGDSGGPLMCESEGRFYVAGVMSWLINNCSATNFPNVFTRLPNYTEWLYKELDYFEWMRHL